MRAGTYKGSHDGELKFQGQALGAESRAWSKGSCQVLSPALPVARKFLLKRLCSAIGDSYNEDFHGSKEHGYMLSPCSGKEGQSDPQGTLFVPCLDHILQGCTYPPVSVGC